MRSLPPFDGLVAFESTARHRSMTLAATELGLTQSAVSHRLRKLEAFLGAKLFNHRSGTGLSPTVAGASLLTEIVGLLDDMAMLRARYRAAAQPAVLKVGVGAALSHYWLVRRLPGFLSGHRDVGIELVVAESEAQARAADVDIQVLWLPKTAARSTSTQRLLFKERVFPVAMPRLLPRARPLRTVHQLASYPIIHKGRAGRDDGAEWSWSAWFARLGLGAQAPDGMRVDTISLALAAAIEGAGIALGRSLLVHDALAERRLTRVLSAEWDMPSSKVHVVRWPAILSSDARVRLFTGWLASEAARLSDAE
ncbi:LysR family transcriptional regulator [Bradyrhizobium sp. SSBR45G]|uniref:LysR substrate-binding domain-containing protein n=1 Tax=unclassified Bradyrhizobium TaxID=2631580 RepID=UPI002342BAD4|nr:MULTISPECIES: LysR substrate-binding domain-containing protein [unclassified Bradyrhizobium]GLH79446.1 LysR family transcriptional regulator [Bradyrhizobium sp. SSBR45G]GLH86823.1 LysR family transcriptional regulator [Bradyrhizobium sp. SSBR45R]